MLESKSSGQVAVVSIVLDGGTSVGTAAHLVDVPSVEEGITVSSVCLGGSHESLQPACIDKPPVSHVPSSTSLNPAAPSITSTSSNFCVGSIKAVLLQTVRAQLHNISRPERSVEVCLLLDSGSQRSYLSEGARRMLALEPIGEQQLSIATFGSITLNRQSTELSRC